MSFTSLANFYLCLNLLLAVGFLSLTFFSRGLKCLKIHHEARFERLLWSFTLVMVLGLSVLQPLFPKPEIFTFSAKVWSAPQMKDVGGGSFIQQSSQVLTIPTLGGESQIPFTPLVRVSLILLGFSLLLTFGFLVRDLRGLARIRKNSFLLKKFGRVSVFLHPEIQIPFSYWIPFSAVVVLPLALLENRKQLMMATVHELQHHRQRDTLWVYLFWFLRGFCFLNPAIHLWSKKLSEIQEFACDETLVDQKKVDSQAYARCLVQVAQTAIDQKRQPVCATGLLFLSDRKILTRRIEKMFAQRTLQMGAIARGLVAILVTTLLGVASFASSGLLQDRRISLEQAKKMAERAQSETGFPIVVNDLVLNQLNRYLGTSEGRKFMRESLLRMQNYRAMVTDHLQRYGVPFEIMAIPIVESGYQNLGQEHNPTALGAGLWQFIPSTARFFGLRVDETRDERLDVSLETDAAMRYLMSNHLRFKDWHLAVLAYNYGESGVQNAIDKTGSRNAWTLIRKGFENDRSYLPRVMAAIIVMKNPESVGAD